MLMKALSLDCHLIKVLSVSQTTVTLFPTQMRWVSLSRYVPSTFLQTMQCHKTRFLARLCRGIIQGQSMSIPRASRPTPKEQIHNFKIHSPKRTLSPGGSPTDSPSGRRPDGCPKQSSGLGRCRFEKSHNSRARGSRICQSPLSPPSDESRRAS